MERKERLRYTDRAEKIVGKMTLEEKVDLMSGTVPLRQMLLSKAEGYHLNFVPYVAGGNKKYHVPALCFCDGPRGVVCGEGRSTCFPVPILRGASFDEKLEEKIGRAIGREVRAYGGNFYGGVCINLPYYPGWGRSQEVYGEDVCHLAMMGAAMVRGVQSEAVIACLKHYAFNSIENNRFKVNIECDVRTEREVFLRQFKECIDAGAAAVMTAYNAYKGVACGHSEYLIKEILKEEWEFDGIVISDFFWGISDTVKAVKAGVDVEMCHTLYYGKKLVKAVKSGKIEETSINEPAVRIVRTLMAFEDQYTKKRRSYDEEVIGCKEHRQLALQSALEGMTLIKNENQVLPIKNRIKKLAVIGKLAAEPNIGDRGSSRVYPEYVITPLEGIVNYANSYNINTTYYEGEDIEHAKSVARQADAVIFVVGLNYLDEGEYVPIVETGIAERKEKGGDRNSLSLHQHDIELLNMAGGVNKSSIAVLMGGGAICVSEWEKNISSIMYAYYPGQEGGNALAKLIFGEASPSGKLPFVLPFSEKSLPQREGEVNCQKYDYYHGYSLMEKRNDKPFRPYGFGMSYTSFALSDVLVWREKEELMVSVAVKNTGNCEGAEVIQIYVGFSESKKERPVKSLCGFSRTVLQPGEQKQVVTACPIERLKYYDTEKQCFELEHIRYEIFIGTSSDEKDLIKKTIYI